MEIILWNLRPGIRTFKIKFNPGLQFVGRFRYYISLPSQSKREIRNDTKNIIEKSCVILTRKQKKYVDGRRGTRGSSIRRR